MGMENVADSLIPGFDKLEEKFVELVQSMKSVLGDFEPLRKRVEDASAEGLTDNAELRGKIKAGLASVMELKAALDAAVQKVLHRGTAPLGRMCVMRVSLRVFNPLCLLHSSSEWLTIYLRESVSLSPVGQQQSS